MLIIIVSTITVVSASWDIRGFGRPDTLVGFKGTRWLPDVLDPKGSRMFSLIEAGP